MREKIFKILILSFLLSLVFVNYKFFRSGILQAVLISDYNSRAFSIKAENLNKFDLNFPNITQTTIPIILLQGRYLKEIDSIDQAIDLFKKSIKINPYLKMSEGELGIVYFDLEEYDSAYKYSKLAFYSLPNNNTHRYTYFRTLTQREDSLELETAFNLIKDNNNTAHWVQYMLSRKAISRKYTKHVDSIFEAYKTKFNISSDDIQANFFKSTLVKGTKSVYAAADLSMKADTLFSNKKYLESAKLYELSAQIDPFDYTHFQNSALAYSNTDFSKKAIELFDKVIYEFKRKDGKAHFYKGILLLKIDKKSEACIYLKQSVEYGFSGVGSAQIYKNFCL